MSFDYYKRWLMVLTMLLLAGLSTVASAANSGVRFNEIMAGINGDSSVQFVEMVAETNQQKDWGPAAGDLTGRAMLVFYNPQGEETSRYVIPQNPLGSADNPNTTGTESTAVLFATQAFVDLTNANVDFIIPPLLQAYSGKVCFKNNPDNTQDVINLCLSYGGLGFTGDSEANDQANSQSLSILGSASLSRNIFGSVFGDAGHLNADFILSTPTPASTQSNPLLVDNSQGASVLPVALSIIEQGQNLFFKETFNGNGRTCETCHKIDEKFGLTPAKILTLAADDPLFRNEQNVSVITVTADGSVLPSTQAMSKPSDFVIGDTLTGSLGGTATVLAVETITTPVLQKQYFVIGGQSLDVLGNVISDNQGNSGTLSAFIPGNLIGPNPVNSAADGLEISAFLRGGRGLILENIDGFTEREVLRGSPSLMNLKFTAPYGQSGEFPDLQSFSVGAIAQHFPRNLSRVAGVDFRTATIDELDALSAFQDSLVSIADENFSEASNLDRFVVTDIQRMGRDLFFGEALCAACHFGTVLASTFGANDIGQELDTGVANSPINALEGLPTEQDIGAPPNTRLFSVPALFDLKFTAPFFHDNSAATLSESIAFYNTPAFVNSPEGQIFGPITVVGVPENVAAIEAFLNALTEPPPANIFPSSLDFFAIPVGTTAKMTVEITNVGTQAMEFISHSILGVDAADFTPETPSTILGSILPGQTREIVMIYSPTTTGNKTASLGLEIVIGTDTFSLGVPLTGSSGSPAINVNPLSVSFGSQDVNAGQINFQTVEIRNQIIAGANLKINAVQLVGDNPEDFVILPDFASPDLPRGASQFVTLTFDPTSFGQKTAELLILSNDPRQPEITVELVGNSIDQRLLTISINTPNTTVPVGTFVDFSVMGTFSDGTSRNLLGDPGLLFQSSDPNIAFDDFNSVIAFAPGVTTITATKNNVISNGVTLTILPPLPIVQFDITPITVNVELGDFVFFSATELLADGTTQDVTTRVNWSSSDTAVATIDFDGFSFSASVGTATITAVSETGVLANSPATLTVVDNIQQPPLPPLPSPTPQPVPVEAGGPPLF